MLQTAPSERSNPPFWRNERVLAVLTQVAVVAAVLAVLYFLFANMVSALRTQFGVPFSFGFLDSTAGFDIGESLIDYSRQSTYARAFLVGLLNTLMVAALGILFATLLGIAVGVMRLSSNFLVSRIAAVYVDTFRNIPLLVLLIFWAQAVFFKLPRVQEAIILPGPIFMSNRGIAIPWLEPAGSWAIYRWILLAGLVLSIAVALFLRERAKRTGRMPFITLWAALTFAAVAALGWLPLAEQPLTLSRPELAGLNTRGGKVLSQQFMALLTGLTIYTAAFIAEIVRAGIQSVSKGQREAAYALGLGGFQTLRLIIMPQALRVIVPPLTSQYLNLTKNSSLAIAVGYPDLFAVAGNTILNQTGRAVEVFLLVMAVYLAISLLTSAFMNWYNQRIRLVER